MNVAKDVSQEIRLEDSSSLCTSGGDVNNSHNMRPKSKWSESKPVLNMLKIPQLGSITSFKKKAPPPQIDVESPSMSKDAEEAYNPIP